jgi:hypothetical protein
MLFWGEGFHGSEACYRRMVTRRLWEISSYNQAEEKPSVMIRNGLKSRLWVLIGDTPVLGAGASLCCIC